MKERDESREGGGWVAGWGCVLEWVVGVSEREGRQRRVCDSCGPVLNPPRSLKVLRFRRTHDERVVVADGNEQIATGLFSHGQVGKVLGNRVSLNSASKQEEYIRV